MTTGHGPTTTRRRLRAELRRLRLAKGLSIEDVTNEVEWSTSKLIRIENGQVGISVSDLTALLGLYGTTDSAQVDELKALARASRQRTWWSKYQRFLVPALVEFMSAEADAARISHYHPMIVPGLLQTEAYATAINAATMVRELPEDVARARVEVRMMRQRDLLDRDNPPAYTAVLDEAVLRRPVAGDAGMRAQLDHLVELADRNRITMIVIPFSAGPHPGLTGAFALMEYDDPVDGDVLCLETASGNVILRDNPELVADYRGILDRLVEIGLRDSDAIKFIRQVRKDFG